MRIDSLVRRCGALTVLLLTTGFWAGLSAAPLPPPWLCVDDEDCVQTPVEPPEAPPASGDGYTLADATAGLPFTLNTPIPPNITSEATVTPATIQSNKVNGRRLILEPGDYGNQTFGTTDQEVVIQPGVVIRTLTMDRTARRLHIRAEPYRSGRIYTLTTGGSYNNEITDMLFEGLNVDDRGAPNQNNFHGTRIAIINSSIRASEYAVGNFHDVTDFLLANSYAHTDSNGGGNESNMRSHLAYRYVIVDSRLQKSGTSKKHVLRVHAAGVGNDKVDYIYIARNQFDGARLAIRGNGLESENAAPVAATAGIGTVWFENNVIYQPGDHSASLFAGSTSHDSDRPEMFYLRNNVLYTDRQPWFSPGVPRSNWVLENNPVFPYEPPPANSWDFK